MLSILEVLPTVSEASMSRTGDGGGGWDVQRTDYARRGEWRKFKEKGGTREAL